MPRPRPLGSTRRESLHRTAEGQRMKSNQGNRTIPAPMRGIGRRWSEVFGRMGQLGIALAAGAGGAGALAWAAEPRLDQIQVIGTHNSYHVAPAPAVQALIAAAGRREAEGLD